MKKIILTIAVALIPLLGISQNYSLNFDGVDDHVSLGQNFGFENTDQFSVEAWVNMNTQTGIQQIISKLDLSFRGWGFQIMQEGTLGGYLFSTYLSNQRYVEGTTNLVDGLWHHVAMTFDGEDIVLYVDGVLEPLSVSEPLGDLETIVNDGDTRIGNYDAEGFPGEYMIGNIDELRIWEGVRTVTEIVDNMGTELAGDEANLIGYYKMDNIDASCDVEDCSVSAANGIRMGDSGANGIPQFSEEVPVLVDVECGGDLGCVLSVEDFEALQFNVYPNPTSGKVQIGGLNQSISQVSVVNILGNRVKLMEAGVSEFSISEFPGGIYFITVESNGQKATRKVIKR